MSEEVKPDYGDTLEGQMIADYVSTGMTLIDACKTLGVSDRTVYDRIKANPKFCDMMERAREVGFDRMANECLEIADDDSEDIVQTRFGPKLNKEFVARSKLKIETRLKLLSKWHPKKYGEKLQIESKTATVSIPASDDPVAAQRAYEDLLKGG